MRRVPPGSAETISGSIPFACPHCAGSRFADENARWQHAKAKHTRALRPPRLEREQSMGELLAESQIAHACGEPVESWIKDMFPEAFR